MAEQVWKIPHGPTVIMASEHDTNGHSHDGDQAQRPGRHEEPPKHARRGVTAAAAHRSAKEDGAGVSGLTQSHTVGRNGRLVEWQLRVRDPRYVLVFLDLNFCFRAPSDFSLAELNKYIHYPLN